LSFCSFDKEEKNHMLKRKGKEKKKKIMITLLETAEDGVELCWRPELPSAE
jgi:hypothetical protein